MFECRSHIYLKTKPVSYVSQFSSDFPTIKSYLQFGLKNSASILPEPSVDLLNFSKKTVLSKAAHLPEKQFHTSAISLLRCSLAYYFNLYTTAFLQINYFYFFSAFRMLSLSHWYCNKTLSTLIQLSASTFFTKLIILPTPKSSLVLSCYLA